MQNVIIVIPCYNEERRLAVSRILSFLAQNRDKSLLMVNDGSTDGTLEILRGIQRDHPLQTLVLDLPHNVGKGEAVRRGVLEAIRRQADLVGYWDADLLTPLEPARKFCEVLKRRPEIQMVIGCRVSLQGHRIAREPWRGVLGRSFAIAASHVLRLRIYDTQCGAKMLRVTPAMKAAFTRPFLSRWIFDVELMARVLDTRQKSRAGPSRQDHL